MKRFLVVSIFTLSLFFVYTRYVFSAAINTPIIANINNEITNFSDIFISGYTDKDTVVFIYLDGTFIGQAENIFKNENQEKFIFKINFLPELGKHEIFAIARCKNNLVYSAATKIFEISFTDKIDAPKIDKIEQTKDNHWRIFGTAQSGTSIYFYLDDQPLGFYDAPADKAAKISFIYNFDKKVETKNHSFWAYATDSIGRMSESSKIYEYQPTAPEKILKIPKITKINVNNQNKLVELSGEAEQGFNLIIYLNNARYKEIKNNNGYFKTLLGPLSEGRYGVFLKIFDENNNIGIESKYEKFLITKTELKNILDIDQQKKTTNNNINLKEEQVENLIKKEMETKVFDIDEKKDFLQILNEQSAKNNANDSATTTTNNKEQKTFNWNLIIFISFIIAVIVWIIWVNREISKEKKADNQINSDNE
jgi:hypothetical protein